MITLLPRALNARWTVARLLNRLPGMCWAQLVGWVLYGEPLRNTRQSLVCRSDAARCGTCYCGRLDPAGATKKTPAPVPSLEG